MKKRVLSAVLCILMLLTLLPVTAMAESAGAAVPDAGYTDDAQTEQREKARESAMEEQPEKQRESTMQEPTAPEAPTEAEPAIPEMGYSEDAPLPGDGKEPAPAADIESYSADVAAADGSDETNYTWMALNEENFPDESFRTYLEEHYREYCVDYIRDTEDGAVEIVPAAVTWLDCGSWGVENPEDIESRGSIKSLEGIKYFTELEHLYCENNQLTTLDVSKNTKLIDLWCFDNELAELDVSKNTALTELYCGWNNLTELDVTKNPALEYLACSDNKLTELDVSRCTGLLLLYCEYNNLTKLDVSSNTELMYLDFSGNKLETLDVSKNTGLLELYCGGNKLETVDTTACADLELLNCGSMDVENLTVNVADRSKLLLATLWLDADKVTIQEKGVEQTGYPVAGTLRGVLCADTAVLWLTDAEGKQLCGTFYYSEDYRFDAVPNGTYTLRIEYTYTDNTGMQIEKHEKHQITVADGKVTGLPEVICVAGVGNVNGNGTVDVTDVQCLYTYLTSGEIEGLYVENTSAFEVAADVNHDGEVDVYDLQALYERVVQQSEGDLLGGNRLILCKHSKPSRGSYRGSSRRCFPYTAAGYLHRKRDGIRRLFFAYPVVTMLP